jgi:ribose transport system substrate-binding protein
MWFLQRATTLAAAVAAAAVIAACGSSSATSSTQASGSGSSSATSSTEASSSGSSGASANSAGATSVLAPYAGHPSAFPVDEPLKKRPAAGTTFAYLQCSTPFCALNGQILQGATKALGVKLSIVKAGASAQDLQAAMSSIITEKPAAVLVPAVEADSIAAQLRQLHASGIPVVGQGIINGKKYDIPVDFNDTSTVLEVGRILAAWAIQQEGAKANVVFYTTPELSFSGVEEQGFDAEVKQLCSSCTVRNVNLPVATIGSTAPSQVVSELQANPNTNVVVFATEEAATGLPAALRAAGLAGKVKVAGWGPTPGNLQDIKSGGLAGGLGVDTPAMDWAMVDAAARLVTGGQPTSGERQGFPPMQMVGAQDLHGNLSNGFVAYPDFAQRFAKIWSGKSA